MANIRNRLSRKYIQTKTNFIPFLLIVILPLLIWIVYQQTRIRSKATVINVVPYCSYISKWGGLGSGNGQLIAPSTLELDNDDNVLVGDQGNYRIEKFNANGIFMSQWGSKGIGNGQFGFINSIAVDSQNNIYVANDDAYYNRTSNVQKFSSSGAYLMSIGSYGSSDGQFSEPLGIDVDMDGNIYIADKSDKILKYSKLASFLSKWSPPGSFGAYTRTSKISVWPELNKAFVSNPKISQIDIYTLSGQYLYSWGSQGTGDGQFYSGSIGGIAVDKVNSLVYVVDGLNHRVQIFDQNGNFLTKIGSSGTGDGQFNYPTDVAVDLNGNVFVSDTNNHRIQKFRCLSPITPTPIPSPTNIPTPTPTLTPTVTLIPTPTLSPTPTPVFNLLLNSSFETGTGIPENWQRTNKSRSNDIRTDALSYDRAFSFRFVGELDKIKGLIQTITYTLSAGTKLYIGGWLKTLKLTKPGANQITVTAIYSDNTKEKFTLVFPTGKSFDWMYRLGSLTLSKTTKSIIVKLEYSKQNGEGYYDAITLTSNQPSKTNAVVLQAQFVPKDIVEE